MTMTVTVPRAPHRAPLGKVRAAALTCPTRSALKWALVALRGAAWHQMTPSAARECERAALALPVSSNAQIAKQNNNKIVNKARRCGDWRKKDRKKERRKKKKRNFKLKKHRAKWVGQNSQKNRPGGFAIGDLAKKKKKKSRFTKTNGIPHQYFTTVGEFGSPSRIRPK